MSFVFIFIGVVGTGFRVSQNRDFGVIAVEEAKIYSGKGRKSVLLFTLHEGAEFTIEKSEDDWLRIELADGKRGWINQKDIVF